MDIYDVHCHMMFGVDDGSKSEEMSLNMLDIAYNEGIRGIIMTPHYNPRIWKTDKETIWNKFCELKEKALLKHQDYKIYLGNEVYYKTGVADELDNIHTMAGSRYILVEFDVGAESGKICQAVNEFIQYDKIPILAHIERYESILGDDSLVSELIDRGAYIQVNAKSVMGDNGRQVKRFIRKLLKNRLVHFVATDAHRDVGRAPYIKECADYITKKYGEEYACDIFFSNPLSIINNEYIGE